MSRRYRKIKEDMPLLSGEDRGRYFGKLVFCIKTNVIYLLLPPSTSFYLLRMLRRYRKLQEDMPLSAAKIEDDTLASWCSASKQLSFISLYLHLPPSDVKKIYEDKGRYAAFGVEDRGRYLGKLVFCIKTNVFYLPLSPSTSFYLHVVKTPSLYLQGKRSLRKKIK